MKVFVLWFCLLLLVFLPVQAQQTLPLNTPVEGTISTAGDTAVWSFNAIQNSVYSLYVEAEATLDPLVTLQDSSGSILIINDDYAYPDTRDSLLEAITIPATGDYRVVVTGYQDSTGDFTLTLLPGYADVVLRDAFASDLEDWDEAEGTAEVDEGELQLRAEGVRALGLARSTTDLAVESYYVQVDVTAVTARPNWRVGLTLQHQTNDDRYFFEINQAGQWRVSAFEGDSQRVVRDWATHPGIISGETEFTLGALVNEGAFDLFYNGQLIGNLTDSALAEAGVGLGVITADALDSEVTATFDNLIVTVPFENANAAVFPDRLVQGTPTVVVRELERRRVIPVGGRQALNVASSFFESRAPGVDVLPLGRGATYTNFALSTTITLEQISGSGDTGCGLVLRQTGETEYMVAYLSNMGGYGVSVRMGQGFTDGLYGENVGWDATEANRLLVIVNDGQLYYYINGVLVGQLEVEPVDGQVGNAVVNFDPVEALCRFENTWLWTWE
ncbi:MAG: hypothetical protein OHK0046_05310 [Anaerolineae bacterium]